MPPRNSESGLCISLGPLEGPLLAKARHDHRHGAQKKGCHDRRFQQGLGSAVRGQTNLRPMVRKGVGPAHQLEMLAVCQTFRFFLPDIRGHHVLIRSDSKSVVSYINHQGGLVSKRWRTTFLCGLRTSCAHWRWCMCRAKWTKEETCCQGTMSFLRNGHSTRSWLREFRKPLARLE